MARSHPTGQLLDTDDGADARIRLAEAAIAKLKVSFGAWVKADLDLIDVHLTAAESADCSDLRSEQLEALRRIAHNIKGQGGTFGCHALSEVASELDALIKRRGGAGDVPKVGELVARLRDAFAEELP